MSALIEQYESFNLAANDRRVIAGLFDFVFFEALPTGVLVSINGEPLRARRAASTRGGVPGRDDIQTVEFLNTTGSTQAVAALFGTGSFEISGEVTLIGSMPLPAGASTLAAQNTGNTALASIIAALGAQATAFKQDFQSVLLGSIDTNTSGVSAGQTIANGYLQTLASPTLRTPRVLPFNAGSDLVVTDARHLDITNTGGLPVTVSISGQPDFTLLPGLGIGFPLLHPRDTGYGEVTIFAPTGADGFVVYTL